MSDSVQDIKSRLDIVEVIKGYIRLEKAGINFKGLCPFHNEKTPSFFVSPTKQMWHCFGCSKGGDIFAFVQAIENIEFIDALHALAERAGVTLERQDPKLKSQRQRLYDALALAEKFYSAQLKENASVKEYLASRGLTQTTIEEFHIGYAPNAWDGLYKFLLAKGFKSAEIAQAGLVSAHPSDSTRYYDRFRGRIIFPIWDISDRTVGFGGRIFESGQLKQGNGPKYINTPATLVYDKGRMLYGLNKSKNAIREANVAILVEGYMDFLMSWQAGVKNIVASSGTALTVHQLDILKRITNVLLSAFDTDEAGQSATRRSIDLALFKGFEVRVLQSPQGMKDPADIVKASADMWKETVVSARPIMEFYFSHAFNKYNAQNVADKKSIAHMLIPEIKKLSNAIEQAHWISELSSRLKIKEQILEEELKKTTLENVYSEDMTNDGMQNLAQKKERKEMFLDRLIYLLEYYPQGKVLLNTFETKFIPDIPAGKVILAMKEGTELDEYLKSYKDYVSFKNGVFDAPQDPEKEIIFCLQTIRSIVTKEHLTALSWRIKEAERANKYEEVQRLIEEFKSISKTLHQYQS